MIKLTTYQEEMVNVLRNGESVVCNWARGTGKDVALAHAILSMVSQKVVLVNKMYGIESLVELMSSTIKKDLWLQAYVVSFTANDKKIEIKFSNGFEIEVTEDYNLIDDNTLVYFEDHMPHKFVTNPPKQFVFMTTQNNYGEKLQSNFSCRVIDVDIFAAVREGIIDEKFVRDNMAQPQFLNEYAILCKKSEYDISFHEFQAQALKRLQRQFLMTRDSHDTVLTRKNIMEMIKDLKQLSK